MKNGFTLVELLAVMAILLSLILITTISVSTVLSNSKQKLTTTQINLIVDSANIWLVDNMNLFEDYIEGDCTYINATDLVNRGYLDPDTTTFDDNVDLDDIKITIRYESNSFKVTQYDEQNDTLCENVYE